MFVGSNPIAVTNINAIYYQYINVKTGRKNFFRVNKFRGLCHKHILSPMKQCHVSTETTSRVMCLRFIQA